MRLGNQNVYHYETLSCTLQILQQLTKTTETGMQWVYKCVGSCFLCNNIAVYFTLYCVDILYKMNRAYIKLN